MMLKKLKALREAMLDRLGVIRQTTTNVPLLNLGGSQFARDVDASVAFHKRRMGIDRRIESNAEVLK